MKSFCFLAVLLLVVGYVNAQTNTSDTVYSFVEQNPQFPGGDAALMAFLQKNIHYPNQASDDDFCGKVVMRLVIDTDGSIINQQIISSCGAKFDQEFLRVIKLVPRFKPGYQNGKPVKVYFNLPVHFEPGR